MSYCTCSPDPNDQCEYCRLNARPPESIPVPRETLERVREALAMLDPILLGMTIKEEDSVAAALADLDRLLNE